MTAIVYQKYTEFELPLTRIFQMVGAYKSGVLMEGQYPALL